MAARSPQVLSILDSLGIVLSALCALHCAATPILLLLLPFAWTGFEGIFASAAGLTGVLAIVGGAVLHGRPVALPFLVAGLLLLGVARLGELPAAQELTASVAASASMIVAHALNRRCAHPQHHSTIGPTRT
jgi:hypothetical protein